MNTTAILQTIAEELTPYLGQTMARTSVDLHCRTMKIDSTSAVTTDQVDALLQKLSMGLHIFIGRDKTAPLINSIRLKLRR